MAIKETFTEKFHQKNMAIKETFTEKFHQKNMAIKETFTEKFHQKNMAIKETFTEKFHQKKYGIDKKGYTVVLDAILALTFAIIIFTAFSSTYFTNISKTASTSFKSLHYLSEDILDVLNKQRVLDAVGEEWALNNTANISRILNAHLEKLVPSNIGYRVTIENDVFVENTSRTDESKAIAKTHSARMLVGYGKGLPTMGYVARSSLVRILSKTTSSFLYFGGFEGEGNLTKYFILPSTFLKVNDIYMELDSGSSFNLFINDIQCGSTYMPSIGNMSANIKEDITSCGNSLNPGDNEIKVLFVGNDITRHYIGGGFIGVTYNTSEMVPQENGTIRYYLPGISGFINYYSGFYVPGNLNSMGIHLHLFNNYTTYLTIGSTLIYTSRGNTSEQIVDIGSNVTIPPITGNADIVLITDISGSMNWQLNSTSLGISRNCADPLLNEPNTRRISLAKCLDNEFIDIILNTSGNRVGLVGFSGLPSSIPSSSVTTVILQHNLSTNNVSLKNQISSYNPNGATGTCGAIRAAYRILEQQSNASRNKYIVLMTDGLANVQCNPSDFYSTTGCIPFICQDTSFCTGGGCLYQQCGDYVSDRASNDSINASCKSFNDLNITVYAVGFGPVSACPLSNSTLQSIATCGNGSYFASGNATELQSIYRDIAQTIVTSSYSAQIANVTNVSKSILYPDSYIDIQYTSDVSSEYGEISITLSTDRFESCNYILYLPAYVRVMDAKVTSYSGEHWTDYLTISNSQGTNEVYTLRDSHYGNDYTILGDPYIVQIPVDYIKLNENNTLVINTGDAPSNHTGCSPDNRAIYTLNIKGFVDYGNVFPRANGCIWTIEFTGGTITTVYIPGSYNGTMHCYYMGNNITYDNTDAIDDAAYRLFRLFDFNSDGRLDILIDQNSLIFDLSQSGSIRSLWGPIIIKLILWF